MAVIPARWASTRLPGKALADIGGRPMLQHVWERVRGAERVDRVIVATDDERIEDAARAFGAEVRMTSPDHVSGTDRVAEAVRGLDAQLVVNVQGDEPMLEPETVDQAVEALLEAPAGAAGVGTLAFPIADAEELADPHLVKVAVDARGHALYFSRAPIPYDRAAAGAVSERHRGHVGLYAFRREALERFVSLDPGVLERMEGLEQLRFLENGIGIRVATTARRSIGVDTPEDLARVRAQLAPAAREVEASES